MNGLEWPGPLWRLGQFRARHPSVVIQRDARLGFWQAWIPVSNGGTVITRYVLQDLLDKLDELLGPERTRDSSGGSAGPGPAHQDNGR